MTLALLGSLSIASGAATAGDGERSLGPSNVDGVQIEGLRGSLTVLVDDRADVDVVVKGDEGSLDDVDAEIVDGVLRITLPTDGGAIVTNDGNIVVVTSGGGTSKVQIGDKTITSDTGMFDIQATVPKGTAIGLDGLVGDVDIGDTEADVFLGCASCKANLGMIRAFEVVLSGSGEIAVDHVEHSLVANISGGGDIDIKGGDVEAAVLNIVGHGDIDFAGHAVDAAASIVGSGKIRIFDVDNPIQQSIIGSGDIVTGE